MSASLRVFGGLRLESSGGPLAGRALQKKRLALLALLAGAPGGRLSRDKLTALLWPESDAERSRHQLASSVYELRKALGEDTIVSAGDDVALDRGQLPSDLTEFQGALAAGDRERAVGLYAGPFLDGFFLSEASEFERWVEGERARLAHAYARALEELARERAGRGDAVAAVEWWRRLAAHDVYNARIAAELIEALDAAGDRAGALRHARIHSEAVRGALGVEPDPAVAALADRLRTTAPPAKRAAVGRDVAALPEPPRQPVVRAPSSEQVTGEASPATPGAKHRPRRRALRFSVAAAASGALLLALAVAPTESRHRVLGALGLERGDGGPRAVPVVLLMDSPHPSRVYDEELVAVNATNADVLNDVLRDLPVQRVKETAGPYWHRHEEIRQLRPDLVVIHLSAFCQQQCEPQRVKMRAFIEYLADTDAQFIIYSRMPVDEFTRSMQDMLGDLPRRFPRLRSRIHPFLLTEHGGPNWKDPATAAALKLRVKELLRLK